MYPTFLTGSFACKKIGKITEIKSLPFLDDFFLKFAMIIEQKIFGCFSLDSEKDYDNNIYYYILYYIIIKKYVKKTIVSLTFPPIHQW